MVIMKTLTIFCSLMKKNIKFYPNSSFIILLVLILFITWMSGLVSTCFAQSPWTQKANIPTIRADHSSCALDGKIYLLGGGSGADQGTKTLYVYDPILNSWDSKADMAKSRMRFPVCVFNGKILAIGGSLTMHSSPITSIEEYDPVSDSWTDKAIMPRARLGLTAAVVDGKIYIIGGCTEAFNPIAEVDVYDPSTGAWTTAADLLTPRWWSESVVLNGKIYVLGGEKSPPWNGIRTVEAYDHETDTWSSKADMITQRKLFAACVLNGMIYVFGGAMFNTGGPTSKVEAYDPETDTWTPRSDMPVSIVKLSGSVVDGKAYLSGGILTPGDFSTSTKTMYKYNPHNDLLPMIEKVELDRGYAQPGIDSVLITTKMRNPTGITLIAKIETSDQTPVDSLQLFDDGVHNDGNAGDSLYANVWPVSSSEENHYYVDLKVTRIETDTVINYINNMASFTTIGPVEFENYTFYGTDTI
jgi:N-acetylneuraminic acid mutarotase